MRSARLPADGGLAGLGLVMQLGGGMFTVLTAQMGFSQLWVVMSLPGEGGAGWLFLLTVLGLVRSIAHSVAGGQLVNGFEGRKAVIRYLVIAGVHTAMWLWWMSSKMHADQKTLLSMAMLFGAWPLALGASMMFGLLDIPEGRLPIPRDRGFDGLGCLMAVLGAGGLLYGLVMTLAFVEMAKGSRSEFEFQVLMLLMILLIIRSVIHVRAAIRALSSKDLDATTEAGSRYGNYGVTISIVAGALLFMMMMKGMSHGLGMVLFLMIACVVGMLLVWPMAVRKFVTDRRYLGDDDPALRHQQSTDGGMSAIGWLLFAFGAIGMATALPAALWPHAASAKMEALLMFSSPSDKSPWLLVAVAGLQLWAAIELCAATDRSRTIAMLYGAVASVITLYSNLGVLSHLERLGDGFTDPTGIGGVAALALALVVPGTTFFLAMRPPPPVTPDLGRVFE